MRQVEEQAAEIAKLKDELSRGRTASEAASEDGGGRLRARSNTIQGGMQSQTQQAAQQAAAMRQRRTSAAGTSSKNWGLLDLLGIGTQPNAAQPNGGAAPTPSGSGSGHRSRTTAASCQRTHAAPPQPDAMPVLQSAVKAIQKHFAAAEAPGSTKTIAALGSDQQNKDIAVLVRGQLCTALSRVLLHGFKSFKLIGRYHIWDFVNESCEATHKRIKAEGVKYTQAENSLTAAVVEVNSHEGMANNPNIKFRSFVCCGLNNRLLHEWMQARHVARVTRAARV